MRFSINSVLLIVSAIALICAMATRFEMQMLLIFLSGVQILSVLCAIQNWRRPYVFASSIAVVLSGVLVLAIAFYEFSTAPMYNGHLYHEDGPQVFASLCLIAFLVLSVFGTSVSAAGIFAFRWIRQEDDKA